MTNEATYAVALRRFAAGEFDAAFVICELELTANPADLNCVNLMGTIRFRQKNYSEASDFFTRAVRLNESDPDIRINLASTLVQMGNFASAAEQYTVAARINPLLINIAAVTGTFLKVGREKLGQHKFAEAASAFVTALRLDGNAINMNEMLIKDPELAMPTFEAMLAELPGHFGVRESFGCALSRGGRISEARVVLDDLSNDMANGNVESERFHRAYNDGLVATKTRPIFRRRLRFESLAKAFLRTKDLDGEIAECGCLWGLSAFVIARHTQFINPSNDGTGIHIFDSFEGLSEPVDKDRHGAEGRVKVSMRKGNFAASLDTVARNLAGFPGIQYYPGWIPSRFHEVEARRFRFLNLDVDLYEPTRDSIMFFYPRLVPGGIIVSDDYNWPGCREAINECSAILGYEMELTETDQAIITKR